MDGAYGPRGAVFRAQLLGAAARAGIPARVLGFSWSNGAHKSVVRVLRRTSRSTLLLARDPLSLARLHDAGISWAKQTSDTVFSLPASASADSTRAPFVVLNISGLIHARQDLTEDYLSVIRHIRGKGLNVIVLPHVMRLGDDDAAAAREVLGHVDDPGVVMAENVDSPAKVSSLVAGAEWVLTGRMHLGILALNQGTPAIVLSTQGKVEGLMGYFGLEHLAIEPVRGFATRLAQLLEDETREQIWRERVEQNLSHLRDLSRENFRPMKA
jgi:colanic acid/amylovoran biosynthesis protein